MTALAILSKAEEIKENMYKYIAERRDVSAPQIIKDLDLTKNQVTHYLKFLVSKGMVTSTVIRAKAKRMAVYNKGKAVFVKKEKDTRQVAENEIEIPEAAKPYLKVYRLMDRKVTEKAPAGRKPVGVGSMQSGMQLFSNW